MSKNVVATTTNKGEIKIANGNNILKIVEPKYNPL
jgi:hypothetical protein